MNGFNIPIIRLEVEHMKQTLMVALSEQAARMDIDLKAAVESYCTPGNISRVVHEETYRIMNAVIKEEVERFFRFGEGRQAIAEAVKARLLSNKTGTPLDEVQP